MKQWLLSRLLASWQFNRHVDDQALAQLAHARFSHPGDVPLAPLPAAYAADRVSAAALSPPAGTGAIFITARFRTGSTFLWQLFNALPGFAAFYEPLNERHGEAVPWTSTDPTHRGASDYRQHYSRVPDLRALHRQDWAYRNLYLDEGDRDADLQTYISTLCRIDFAVPVLQFNRVDFRLRWLKAHFPGAKILHLYRSPREQWLSMLGKTPVTPNTSLSEFAAHDGFYLLPWARDLARVFPFLLPARHRSPYALHYLIWRLSYAQGLRFADYSFSYEDLLDDVPGVMARALSACGQRADPDALATLDTHRDPPPAGRWSRFASAEWFAEQEYACERQLEAAFGGA